MKMYLFSVAALAALVLPLSAQVAIRPNDVKLEKVMPSVVKTPEFSITGGQNKRYQTGSWLEVEVEFQSAPDMVDELTFNYKMLINGKLLVGEVTHVNIPKGREHYSVAYVSPRSLESVMMGKPMTSASIGGIWVEMSHQGQVLGVLGSNKGTAVPNVPQVQGMVLNKTQTPFAPLYWDRYEAIKSTPR